MYIYERMHRAHAKLHDIFWVTTLEHPTTETALGTRLATKSSHVSATMTKEEYMRSPTLHLEQQIGYALILSGAVT